MKSAEQSNASDSVKNQPNTSPSKQNSNEILSPSGRPVRHCVREISTYKDEVQVDVVNTRA